MGTRALGIDVGRRRIGLAVSDASAVLARPLATLDLNDDRGHARGHARGDADGDPLSRVLTEVARLASEDDGLGVIVVGLPRRLDGSPNEETPRVQAFVESLRKQTPIPVVTVDERLTSREAESRLALQEPDWRKRKAKLDAAAAAVILQDYLDNRSSGSHA